MDKLIPVNDEWRLRLEPLNVVLERYRLIINPKDQSERYDWGFVGYYGSIAQAVKEIPVKASMLSQFETLAELNSKIGDLADALQTQLEQSA